MKFLTPPSWNSRFTKDHLSTSSRPPRSRSARNALHSIGTSPRSQPKFTEIVDPLSISRFSHSETRSADRESLSSSILFSSIFFFSQNRRKLADRRFHFRRFTHSSHAREIQAWSKKQRGARYDDDPDDPGNVWRKTGRCAGTSWMCWTCWFSRSECVATRERVGGGCAPRSRQGWTRSATVVVLFVRRVLRVTCTGGALATGILDFGRRARSRESSTQAPCTRRLSPLHSSTTRFASFLTHRHRLPVPRLLLLCGVADTRVTYPCPSTCPCLPGCRRYLWPCPCARRYVSKKTCVLLIITFVTSTWAYFIVSWRTF